MADAERVTDQMLQITIARTPRAGQTEEVVLHVPHGTSVQQALQAAGWWQPHQACGIWGRVQAPDTVVQAGDRVEQYRPLTVDPKVARRERFAQQGARGTGLFAVRRANSKKGI